MAMAERKKLAQVTQFIVGFRTGKKLLAVFAHAHVVGEGIFIVLNRRGILQCVVGDRNKVEHPIVVGQTENASTPWPPSPIVAQVEHASVNSDQWRGVINFDNGETRRELYRY